jgi:hypothetical protein
MGRQDEMVRASGEVIIENYGRLSLAAARGCGSRLPGIWQKMASVLSEWSSGALMPAP